MRLIANIAPTQHTGIVQNRDALAYLTSTGSGWLLGLVLHVGDQRLVGSKLVTQQLEPTSESAVHARLKELASRLSNDLSEASSIGIHIEKAARVLARTLRRRRPAEQSVLSSRQLRISTGLLGSNLNETLQIYEIARTCGVSESHLRRAFRTCTGLSPRQWRQEKRLQFCRQRLVETDAPLATISREAGFAVQSHFSRVFTQSTGMSPSEWRRVFQSVSRAGQTAFIEQNFRGAASMAEGILP